MSTPRRVPITRRSAARALDHGGPSGVPALDQVLSAAAAPVTRSELDHEADAVAMFRVAHLGPVQTTGRSNMVKTTLSKLNAAKMILAGASALTLATGGVALAATTGHLPNPLGPSHQSPVGAAHAHSPNATPTAEATDGDAAETPGTPAATPSANPSPSLTGLCHAFQALESHAASADGTNNGKALSNPAFTALSNAAGGVDNVATYCVGLIGTPTAHPTDEPGSDATHPTHPAKPAHPVKPTQAATPTRPAHPMKPTQAATPTPPANDGANRPDALPTQANGHVGD